MMKKTTHAIVSAVSPTLFRFSALCWNDWEQMEQETRGVFFSLGGSSGSARVYDEKVAGRGEQGTEAARDDTSAAADSGRQSKTGTTAHGSNNKQPIFSANFGTKQAWASIQEPAIRTQGRHHRETQIFLHCFVYLCALHIPVLPKSGAPYGRVLFLFVRHSNAVPQRSLAKLLLKRNLFIMQACRLICTLVSGPYLGKDWGARREADENTRHLLNPKRWTVTGAKVSHVWQHTEHFQPDADAGNTRLRELIVGLYVRVYRYFGAFHSMRVNAQARVGRFRSALQPVLDVALRMLIVIK